MTTKDLLRQLVEFGHEITQSYVADLNDADLLVRSVPESNHIAWQLGHQISSVSHILKALGHAGLALPEGFEAAYTRETSKSDKPADFAPKAKYLALMEQAKTASLDTVDATPDAALDNPGPESMRAFLPTVGAALGILGTHWLMHAGQFVPIRRKLGRKAMF